MLGAPAGLYDVINYADFKKETLVEPLDDPATLEDSPDEQEIQDPLSGNITVNGSRIAILQDGKKISYCLSLFSIDLCFFLSAGSLSNRRAALVTDSCLVSMINPIVAFFIVHISLSALFCILLF